jgi:hypothetical protein
LVAVDHEVAVAVAALVGLQHAVVEQAGIAAPGPVGLFTRQPTSELPCQFGGLLFSGIDHVDRTAIVLAPIRFAMNRKSASNAMPRA